MAEDDSEAGGEDDGMGLDKAGLKKFVKLAKIRPMTFAFCPASGQDEALFAAHRKRKPDSFGKAARKEAEQTKVSYGKMSVEGKTLTLTCDKTVPGMDRKLAKMFRKMKVPLDVKIVEGGGGGGENVA